MRIEQYLNDIMKRDGAAHLTLIDPDAQDPTEASDIADAAAKAGSDAIVIGGSVGASGDILDETLRAIKTAADLPTILFPSGACGLSRYADCGRGFLYEFVKFKRSELSDHQPDAWRKSRFRVWYRTDPDGVHHH
jgi:hypothetical protein